MILLSCHQMFGSLPFLHKNRLTSFPRKATQVPFSQRISQSLGSGWNGSLYIKDDVRNICIGPDMTVLLQTLMKYKDISHIISSFTCIYTMQPWTQTGQPRVPIQKGIHSRIEDILHHQFTVILNPTQQMLEGPLSLTGNVPWLYFNSDAW